MVTVILIAIFTSFISVFVSAQNEESIIIHIPGELTHTRFDHQVVVAGVWHYFNVTTETQNFQELSLKFFSGKSIPNEEDKDETNYYEWHYNKNNEVPWIDIKKYGNREYINTTRSIKNGNIYSFFIGIKDTLPPQPKFYNENWTLETYVDGDKTLTENIVVEKPTVGLAKSHGDIILFKIDPFTKMDAYGNDYFRIENTGNLPININVDYKSYNDIVEYSIDNSIVSRNNNMKFDPVIIHSESLPPGKKDIDGTINGKIQSDIIIPVASVTFGTSLTIDAPILRIVAAHANYELEEFIEKNMTFQYQKTLKMSENEIMSIKTYISGNGIVDFNLKSENISILSVLSNNKEVNIPIIISSTDKSEHGLTIRIKALKETNNARLQYILDIDGEIYEYETSITISPPQSQEEEGIKLDFLIIIVIVLIICLVIGYMVNTHLKYSRK